jgi:hypothetical protein
MTAPHFTPEENELVQRVLKIRGVSIRILKKSIYNLLKLQKRCINPGCKASAVEGQVRCAKHQSMNARYILEHKHHGMEIE